MIKIFTRNFWWFSTIHDIFNIELFPNYASHRIKAKFEYESFTDTKSLKPANLGPAHQNYFIYSSIITLLIFKCISLKSKINFVKNLTIQKSCIWKFTKQFYMHETIKISIPHDGLNTTCWEPIKLT